MSGRSYFPRLINLSINDFSFAISYWFTVTKVSWKLCSAASASVMSRTMAERKLRSIHSKNLYKELDNFSTAFMNKMKRRKIHLFSGKYFEVERLIVEGRNRRKKSVVLLVTRLVCMHSFWWIYICTSKKARFFIFWKGKRVNLRENVTSKQGDCFGSPLWIAKI